MATERKVGAITIRVENQQVTFTHDDGRTAGLTYSLGRDGVTDNDMLYAYDEADALAHIQEQNDTEVQRYVDGVTGDGQ